MGDPRRHPTAPTVQIAAAYLIAYLVLRIAMAWMVGVWGVGDEILRRKLWLVPFRDAIYFFVWIASFASKKIQWGGEQYTMQDQKMSPATTVSEPRPK